MIWGPLPVCNSSRCEPGTGGNRSVPYRHNALCASLAGELILLSRMSLIKSGEKQDCGLSCLGLEGRNLTVKEVWGSLWAGWLIKTWIMYGVWGEKGMRPNEILVEKAEPDENVSVGTKYTGNVENVSYSRKILCLEKWSGFKEILVSGVNTGQRGLFTSDTWWSSQCYPANPNEYDTESGP